MTLRDTLTQLQQKKEQEAERKSNKPKLIEEWKQAVAELLKQLRSYLTEYEADGSMSFTESKIEISEEMLGKYRVPKMDISAPPVIVIVAPVGRMIVGATGRVDMYRQGRVGEADRITILRVQTSPTDQTPQWAIRPPPEIGAPRMNTPNRAIRQIVPLTKETFEQAIEFLLKW